MFWALGTLALSLRAPHARHRLSSQWLAQQQTRPAQDSKQKQYNTAVRSYSVHFDVSVSFRWQGGFIARGFPVIMASRKLRGVCVRARRYRVWVSARDLDWLLYTQFDSCAFSWYYLVSAFLSIPLYVMRYLVCINSISWWWGISLVLLLYPSFYILGSILYQCLVEQ